MKKTFIALAAALPMLSMVACSGQKGESKDKADEPKNELYTGVLPAADAAGVRYELSLDYKDSVAGAYDLTQTYMVDNAQKTDSVVKSKGDFTTEMKDGKSYLKLTEAAKDSTAEALAPLCFVVDSDSTITMVNSALEVSTTPGMNYTLTLSK